MSISRGDSAENVERNRELFLQEFGIAEDRLAMTKQISRDGIQQVDGPGTYAKCDALISSQPNTYLSILTADCSPVLLWSEEKPVVAAVHSGWQGSELDILGSTINTLLEAYKISPDSLKMLIGPGLSREYFEVGPEFKEKFEPEFLNPIPDTDRFYFDNNNFLKKTAMRLGVLESSIEILNYCSYRDDELFFSHRRDKNITGRMMALIGIKS